VEVNNYQEVFPTGKLIPVKGTAYDFSEKGGALVQSQPHSFDDCFVDLKKEADDSSISEMIDPAAHIGMRLTALSREINAVQLGCQPEGQHVCLEPQFNWADPFGKEWGGDDTHMATLLPGQSVTWRVRMELFRPRPRKARLSA
jgi:galactose mutarotase-like enzyme